LNTKFCQIIDQVQPHATTHEFHKAKLFFQGTLLTAMTDANKSILCQGGTVLPLSVSAKVFLGGLALIIF